MGTGANFVADAKPIARPDNKRLSVILQSAIFPQTFRVDLARKSPGD
jgi:hypothetical protein